MEQLGGIIFLIIFLLVLPGIAVYGVIKWIREIFHDVRKIENHRKKMEERDDVSYKTLDGETEYHQYSFYSHGLSRGFSRNPIPEGEIIKQQTLFYVLTGISFLTGKYKYSEIILRNANTRYTLKNKIVVTEHLGSLYIFYSGFIIYIFTIYSYSLLLGLFALLFFGITNESALDMFMDENVHYLLIYLFSIIPLGLLSVQVANPWKITRLLKQQSMESLEFENNFDAYSKDPIEARIIITPALMDRIEEISKKWGLTGKIRIIWKGNDIIFAIKGDIGTFQGGSENFLASLSEDLSLNYYKI